MDRVPDFTSENRAVNNDCHHPPRSLAGPFWSEVLTRLAPRLESVWGELARTSLTWSDTPTSQSDSGERGPSWEGPLEPLDESLRIELSPRLCQGLLGRMQGGTETVEEADARAGGGFGRLELQLLERLVVSAAVEFCGVLHEVSGLPVTMPCLWLSSIEGTAANPGPVAGVTRAGTAPPGASPGRGSGFRADTGTPPAPAARWRVHVRGTGLAGWLTFGLPEGVLALLEQTGQRRGSAAEGTATVTAEVVLAEVELPATEVWNLEVGDVIPLGRAPGREGEAVFLDIPGVGRVPAVAMFRDGVLEVRRLSPGESPPGASS